MANPPPDPARGFLGIGWAFPVRFDHAAGDVALAVYEESIRQSVRLILDTNRGERVMRPDFGADLRALVFQPMNTTTVALVRHRVEEALTLWEPRIDSIAVQITAEGRLGRLLVEVRYRVRATNTFYNLVYPFYLQEGRP